MLCSIHRTPQGVALTRAWDITDFETSPLQYTPQLQVWLCTVDRVDAPLHTPQPFPLGVPGRQRCKRGESPLAAAIDVCELKHQGFSFHPKPSQKIRGTRAKHNWFVTQHDGLQVLVPQRQNLIYGVTFNQHRTHDGVLAT